MKQFEKAMLINTNSVDTSLLSDELFASLDLPEYTILPGFCDVHVHFREPGFIYKETIKTGSTAAAYGGFTTVFTMANLNPVPDSVENLKIQLDAVRKDAKIEVIPYGSITVGELGFELADFGGMAKDVAGFSDDGHGVQNDEMMRMAMLKAKSLDKVIVAHCEVNSLLNGGYIHAGEYAKAHGHMGICSASEYEQIERDIKLAEETGCPYHVCHISTKESVALIRDAKARGVDITCETAPHYLVLDEGDLIEHGRFKMNPPLRGRDDREALLEGIIDGTIDMIATDHAPHSDEEKSKGLEKSPFGVVGLETAFPVMYTYLVREKIITLEKLIKLMSYNPRQRFKLPETNDFSVWDLNESYVVDSDKFKSMGHSTPFEGAKLYGKHINTIYRGKAIC